MPADVLTRNGEADTRPRPSNGGLILSTEKEYNVRSNIPKEELEYNG